MSYKPPFSFKKKYDQYINGAFVEPSSGKYFDNISPIDGKVISKIAQGNAQDIEKALDAAHNALATWSETSVTDRSNIMLKAAQLIEDNAEVLAQAETLDKGKVIRESIGDVADCADHLRYFAGVIRADEGSASELDSNTLSVNIPEPIGVVGAIIPWNYPLLIFIWKLAPTLATGCTMVVKPAEQTPASILVMMEIIGSVIPKGVVNVVNGFGKEAGAPLAQSAKVDKITFTGSTATGQQLMRYAAESIIPTTMELGGKSPNVFMPSIADEDDDFYDKCVEGAVLFALNQGEDCTCPSRLLIHEDIYEDFIARIIARTESIKQGNPFDEETQISTQVSKSQYDKILNYIQIGIDEGCEVLCGGAVSEISDIALQDGFYIKPTILKGHNKMRVFQEEIFGPVVCVTTFKNHQEAIEIANDTKYGLGAAVWTRDMHEAYLMPRKIKAGRVWVNNYHTYPAHAPFGGYKQSGYGRENHKMMLSGYRKNKNILISYDKQKWDWF
ncbi:aldehyde dehydrogenase family protein [Maribacter sp. Asnod1-A12]|uniref:aldehyde dehydrogenase family protein n=1 Tax=Maribacter sp. Asnod1-A12 TaxID=3160576 RepID=UPI003862E468